MSSARRENLILNTLIIVIFLQSSTRGENVKSSVVLNPRYLEEFKEIREIQNGSYFLFEPKKVTEHGRYFNQTEGDFATLLPSCSCQAVPSNCSQECCYCQLGCPLMENSFTKEVILNSDITCLALTTPETIAKMQGRRKSTPGFPWACRKTDEFHGPYSRLYELFCVFDDSLSKTRVFHNINPGWTSVSEDDKKDKYFWRQDEKLGPNENTDLEEMRKADELISWDPSEKPFNASEEILRPGMEYAIDGINFTMSETSEENQTKLIVKSPFAFNVSVPEPCAKLSGKAALGECVYTISGAAIKENCTLRRDALRITARILAFAFTNLSTAEWANVEENGGNEVGGNGGELDRPVCESIPGHGVITEVRYRGNRIAVYIRFGRFSRDRNLLPSFPLRLSFAKVQISEETFANLPKFWNKIFYGKCPDQFCWRDMFSIGLDEAGRLSDLDDLLWRNVLYCLIPLLPVLAYFSVHTLI